MRASGKAFDGYGFLSLGITGYTSGMDSVRFGRALGVGARAAAKTLVTAVDAAASPNPSGKSAAEGSSSKPATQGSTIAMAQQVVRTAAQARQATAGLTQGGKRLGESVWRPFVRLSGVLWLEFTGVFFGIFATYAASGAWKLRADWHETATNHDGHLRFLMAAGMALVFGYFCVSSFVKAGKRGRKR
jgi:hypothetical protein